MLFKRKNLEDQATKTVDPVATTVSDIPAVATVEMATFQAIQADLTNVKDQLTEANGIIANYENLAKLQEKATKIEYKGDVSKLFEANNGDYFTTLEAMVDGKVDAETETKVESNQEAFLNPSANNPSVDTGGDSEDAPKTQAEAIQSIKNSLNCSQRDATIQARSMYPSLFGKK